MCILVVDINLYLYWAEFNNGFTIQWGIGGDSITLPAAYKSSYVGATTFSVPTGAGVLASHTAIWNKTSTSFSQNAGGTTSKQWLTIGY